MTSKVFTAFLDRHNSEIIEKFGEYFITELPPAVHEPTKEVTVNVVQFYLGRILSTVVLDSEVVQKVIRASLDYKVSQETLRTHVDKFFEILDELRVADTTLSKTEQEHIQRVLEQSHKFLLIDLFSLKQRNLKKD